MINRLQNEFQRFITRDERIAMLPPSVPLVKEAIARAEAMLDIFADRVKSIQAAQRGLLAFFEIVAGIDWTIEKGDEQTPVELLAARKLATHTKETRITRTLDGEIIRPARLDRSYRHPGNRQGLLFFSSKPRPGVYFFPSDGIDVPTDPAYVPFKTEKSK
jgi:hypothetical protein